MKLIKTIIIALVAVVALFFISAVVSGIFKSVASESPTESVQKVLDRETELTQVMKAQDGLGVREKLSNYTHGLSQIDYRKCPADFREVFQAYSNAWIGFTREMESQPASLEEGFVMGALNTLVGESDGGARRMAAARGHWEKQIESTSFRLTESAAKHGAQTHQ